MIEIIQTIATILLHSFFAGLGTLCFAILFVVSPKHYMQCAVNGGIAWIVYLSLQEFGASYVTATIIAGIVLTILSRCFAVMYRAPVTVFLFCGIFPLVPGAKLYYTAYYFISEQHDLCLESGIATLTTAVALAIGISIIVALPMDYWKKYLEKQH